LEKIRIAAVQMVSGQDLDANLRQARELLEDAARQGARMALLPENFALLHTRRMRWLGELEAGGEGPVQQFLVAEAKRLGLWLLGGSMPMAARPDGGMIDDRVRASSLLVTDQGRIAARYDKIHLFDAEVGDDQGRYRESDTFEPGKELVVAQTPAGRLGMATCYDLRFPEQFRALAERGADWVGLPSAFTWKTGQAHWEVLLRARAIENQLWLCGVDQGGWHDARRRTWGHSMFVDPWGRVVDCLAEGPGVVISEFDPALQQQLRESMPVLGHRRL